MGGKGYHLSSRSTDDLPGTWMFWMDFLIISAYTKLQDNFIVFLILTTTIKPV